MLKVVQRQLDFACIVAQHRTVAKCRRITAVSKVQHKCARTLLTDTFLARPSWLRSTFSSFMPSSSLITCVSAQHLGT